MNIEIELNKIDDALHEFNHKKLSTRLDEYIMDHFQYTNIKNKNITITIQGITNKDEKKLLENIIHAHYINKYKNLKLLDNIDDFIRITFAGLGIIAITLANRFTNVLSEIFLITGWVIIWEIIYDILFNEIKRKRTNKIYKILSNCIINFK